MSGIAASKKKGLSKKGRLIGKGKEAFASLSASYLTVGTLPRPVNEKMGKN
jgi:hypothetical protein